MSISKIMVSGRNRVDARGTKQRWLERTCILAAWVAMSVAAHAQDQVAVREDSASGTDIVVTASKREQSIQEVPASIQVVSGLDLDKTNSVGLQDITRRVPGLYLTTGNRQGQNQLSIRGLTSLTGAQPSETATVGYYIDDTPISDSSFVPDLSVFDLERIEVLKGPQGTLFGEGSIGGTVRLIMRKPDLSAVSARFQATAATVYDGAANWRLSGAVNLPLISDTLALRVTVDHNDVGGFVDDVRRGLKNTNDLKSTSVRGALRLQASADIVLDTSVSYQKIDGGTGSFDEPGGGDAMSFSGFNPEYLDDEVLLVGGQASWNLGFAELVAVASYYDRTNLQDFEQRNFSVGLAPVLGASTPVTFPGVAAALPNGSREVDELLTDITTQEIRLVSKDKSRFEWVFGAFHRKRNAVANANLIIADVAPIFHTAQLANVRQSYSYEQWAAFGEATFEVVPGLKLTGGVRVFNEDFKAAVEFRQAGIVGASGRPVQSQTDVLFKAAVAYAFNPDVMVYALYSEGQRPGGLNAQPVPQQGIPLTYGPDRTQNYELGIKSKWADGLLTFNATVFQTDLSDLQVSVSRPGIVTPIGTRTVGFIANAGAAKSRGLEVEATIAPSRSFTFGAAATILDTELTAVDDPTSALFQSLGSEFPNIPSFSGYAFAQYVLELSDDRSLTFRGDVNHVGKRQAFFDNQPNPYMQPTIFYPGAPANGDLRSYELANFQIGYDHGPWGVTAFVSNAFNKQADLSLLGNYRGYTRNPPRTFGITLRANLGSN